MVQQLTREIILSHLGSEDRFPVDFDLGFPWLGFSRKDVAKRSIENAGFKEGIDFQVFRNDAENSKGGRPSEKIFLTVDCFKQWAMMAPTQKGKEVRLWYIRIEEELDRLKGKVIPFSPSQQAPSSEQPLLQPTVAEIAELARVIYGDLLDPHLVSGFIANQVAIEYPHLERHCEAAKKNLILPIESELMTVTELAQLYKEVTGKELSEKGTESGDARKFNTLLTDRGYQTKVKSKKSSSYRPTEKGKPFAKFVLQEARGSSKTVQQLRWRRSLIEDLAAHDEKEVVKAELVDVNNVEDSKVNDIDGNIIHLS
ncbi:antA/AntB antirepressor family protein [Moorena sp. SIO3I6]|uniref:antA/AntB antirepressor family protein n=1 Tax=Moorena sp. SIO3I6 TaxID=2607831 RepID=UPI0013F95428|nr:antA/AntB antirepressor family protein [Moorena sp. SIO3I6]NEP23722.1 hypothetical protein [Moorena sp. SIO3I6]